LTGDWFAGEIQLWIFPAVQCQCTRSADLLDALVSKRQLSPRNCALIESCCMTFDPKYSIGSHVAFLIEKEHVPAFMHGFSSPDEHPSGQTQLSPAFAGYCRVKLLANKD
jgi:hypothetical protein